MNFSDFICFDALVPEIQSEDRDGTISEMINALDRSGKIPKGLAPKIIRAVIERENEASTGMGKGIAVPHVKHSAIKEALGTVGLQTTAGLDFSSLDKQPVFCVFLLLSPKDFPEKHLQAMETIFKHIQQEKFRKFLRQCKTAYEIEDLLKEADTITDW